MRNLRAFFWIWVAVALLTAIAIGTLRIIWEEGARQLKLAIDLGDAQQLAVSAHESLKDSLSALRGQGADALVIDPTQISDLRTGWPELTASAPLYGPTLLDWSTLVDLRRAGWGVIWKVEPPTNWPTTDFAAFLSKLTQLTPQAFMPIDWSTESPVSEEGFQALRGTLDRTGASLILMEFQDFTPATILYRQGFTQFVRGHTISIAERQTLGDQASMARFERAVIERNVRLVYLHLSEQSVGDAAAMISNLGTRLRAQGFRLGELPMDRPPQLAWPTVAILFAGVAALFVLTSNLIWPMSSVVGALLWLAVLGWGLWGLMTDALLSRQLAALLTAILAPISTFALMSSLSRRRAVHQTNWSVGSVWVVGLVVGALLGGLLSAAILSDLPFYEGLFLFRGVKLALVLPILLILALHGGYTLWKEPIRWTDLVLAGGIMVALFFVLLRSGNDSFLPISGLESQTRGLLESLFYARPRFKEFLIGEPLLFLWAAWGLPRLGARSWPLLALGLLGPVSIVNTYEHLHTPLVLSLARTVIGLALGLALGWVLWRALCWLETRWALRAK